MSKFPRALLISAALGLSALALGGCGGFTPLYAVPGVTPKLAAIQVIRPDGRTGFMMGQYLDDRLGFNRDSGEPPVYRLLLKTKELRIPRGIRVDNVASRYELDLDTSYTLVEVATRRVVTSGLVKVNITYDSADQPYAGIAAASDGQERAAVTTADRIRLELATFFASPSKQQLAAQGLGPDGQPLAATAAQALNQANLDAANAARFSSYSERLQGSIIQSPRERALGQPTSQLGQNDSFGQPLQATSPDGQPVRPAFNPSQDPYAIRTLPDNGQ